MRKLARQCSFRDFRYVKQASKGLKKEDWLKELGDSLNRIFCIPNFGERIAVGSSRPPNARRLLAIWACKWSWNLYCSSTSPKWISQVRDSSLSQLKMVARNHKYRFQFCFVAAVGNLWTTRSCLKMVKCARNGWEQYQRRFHRQRVKWHWSGLRSREKAAPRFATNNRGSYHNVFFQGLL
jgi:hypothetical protein